MKATVLLVLVVALSFSVLAIQKNSRTRTATDTNRDQELFTAGVKAITADEHLDQRLFLAGAEAVGKGHFSEGRILLNTLIMTYPESSLVPQARLLVFYSFAREGGPKNEKASMLLKEIEEQIKAYEPMKLPR